MDTKIPFYSNTPDNTHCFQAAIKMIAKYYWPNEEYSWEELEVVTNKVKDLWTWPMAGVLWLQSKGLTVLDIEIFDYQEFVDKKEHYLLSYFGQDVGKEQITHSDIDKELAYSKEFCEKINIQKRIPDINDIRNLLDEGYLLVCCLNSQALNNRDGYIGHFVVVKGYEIEGLIINDPGLPAFENRIVSQSQFEKAWAYPNEKAKNILAFKLDN
ncbi:MAG: cysteine peptidase family C39 domain-containing protein [Candidatus Shapirobacteria bacterium]